MTMVMQTVSKSQFKAQALEFLRTVEEKKQPLIITHNKKPVVKVLPFKEEDPEDVLKSLRGTLKYYKDPFEPAIDPNDWEANK